MAITTYLATVAMPGRSGVSDDLFVTTYHFEANQGNTVATDATAIVAGLIEFWDGTHTGTNNRVMESMSEVIDASLVRIRVYNLLDAEPRVPVLDVIEDWTPTSTVTIFPSEVAVALSYRKLPVSGANVRRQRGRIYIGPIAAIASGGNQTYSEQATTLITRVAGTFQTLLIAAAVDAEAVWTAGGVTWSVFSPTTAGAEPWDINDLQTATVPIEQVRVDQSFDTQRRRGEVFAPGSWTSL